MKRFALPAIVAGLTVCLASAAGAQNFTMKFGTATVNEPQHEYIKLFKDEVERQSGGRIKVEIYPQSQLGPIPRQIEGLQLGTIEAFIGPADFYVGVDKRYGVFSAPILFGDRKNAAATLADAELNKAILALGAEAGAAEARRGAQDGRRRGHQRRPAGQGILRARARHVGETLNSRRLGRAHLRARPNPSGLLANVGSRIACHKRV
jgi:Bacterial extracellular solute-binding protein, family 7